MDDRLHRVSIEHSVVAFPLANVPPYISGELMWSYIARLALANGFASAIDFLNAVSRKWYRKKWHSFQGWNYDLDRAFIDSFVKVEGLEWIIESTLYGAMLPFSSRLSSIRRIYNCTATVPRDDGLLRRPSSDISEIRICPECRRREEEEGLFHLHYPPAAGPERMPHSWLCTEALCGASGRRAELRCLV